MTISVTAIPFAAPDGADGVTSASFDSTGATGLAVFVSRYTGGGAVTVSDSKGNTWTARGERVNGGAALGVQWYTCVNPSSVGPGHTVTVSGTGSFSCIGGYFFTGTDSSSYGGENGAPAPTGTSAQYGSVTPDADGSLVLSGASYNAGTNPSVDSSLTEQHLDRTAAGNNATATGYLVQGTAAAINPTWSWTGSYASVGSNIWLRPAAGGGDTDPPSLSSPTATVTGTTTATVGVTTDEADGTLYAVVTTSGTAPSAAQVKAGQDHAGAAAAFADSQSVSSAGAKTFLATGLSANTTYYAHFMHEDSDANQSDVESTAAFVTRAAISVTDGGLFFSPYNWFTSGSTYKQSNAPGAYLKTKFTGTSVHLAVDVSPLTGASTPAGDYPRILYRVDGSAYTSRLLTSGDTVVTLASGLADTTHTLEIVFAAVAWDSKSRWSPVMVLRVTGLQVDGGKGVAAPDTYGGRMLVYGDSHSEGHEVTASGVNVTNQDASLAAPFLLGRAFECEVGVVAYAGQGWNAQVGSNNGVPDFEDAWDFYHDGQSRLSGGLLDPAPDWIVILHGDNDGSGVQAAVESTLPQLRSAAPGAVIAVGLPPNLEQKGAITAGVAAAGDADTHLIDHGENLLTGPWVNGSHVNQRGHARWAAALARLIQATQTGGGGSDPFPSQGLQPIESGVCA